MPYLLNLLYLSCLVLLSPWLIFKLCATAKWRRNLWAKLVGRTPRRNQSRPCVWFHGVSLGEVLLLRQVVAQFRQERPEYEVVFSTTTLAGLEAAQKHFADLKVFCWPLDFSWAVKRALWTLRPELVVLAESEVWPNFVLAARRSGVKVAVINGRMSPRSFARYRKVAFLVGWLLRRVNLWAMQTEEYAAGIRGLGVPADRVEVTGSVKYDGVNLERNNPGTQGFRRLFAVHPGDLVWVAGSTQTPEEGIVLDAYQRLKGQFPSLRLILVPRQKDRFDAVSELLRISGLPFVRRSQMTQPVQDRQAIILVDSIGELGHVWGLADIAFVGGSLDGQRGGQNMIEPGAYGAAVVFGPHTWNFKDTVSRLLQVQGAIQINDASELEQRVKELAEDGSRRQRLGEAARQFVQSQHGATTRTVTLLAALLLKPESEKRAA
jgi:3-deoxy-D-manno-octulosonic-acid transferase